MPKISEFNRGAGATLPSIEDLIFKKEMIFDIRDSFWKFCANLLIPTCGSVFLCKKIIIIPYTTQLIGLFIYKSYENQRI